MTVLEIIELDIKRSTLLIFDTYEEANREIPKWQKNPRLSLHIWSL